MLIDDCDCDVMWRCDNRGLQVVWCLVSWCVGGGVLLDVEGAPATGRREW